MNIDKIFESSTEIRSFEFNENVCKVFDDMVTRSVPGYQNIQDIISLTFDSFSKSKTFMDVGCSTGTTIRKILDENTVTHGYGIDLSESMLELAREKCSENLHKLSFSSSNLLHNIDGVIKKEFKPDFIILNLVLQFIRPPDRLNFIKNIKSMCCASSTMVVFEKIIFDDNDINMKFIDSYLKWKKKNGYTDSEVANKRQSLENKLIPYLHNENVELFKACGFRNVEVCYSFMNFRGYLCQS